MTSLEKCAVIPPYYIAVYPLLNDCCIAMWKANGNTTTLLLFLDSLFPKTEIHMRDASSGDMEDKEED
jgi:hypothetical protein